MSAVPQKATRREMRTLVMVIAINVAIVVVIALAVGAWFFGEEWTYYNVGDYDLDQGRFIKIVGEKSSLSHMTNLRYEVIVGGKVVLARDADGTRFYTSPSAGEHKDARDFSIVPVEQGDLVAITDRLDHDDIVILHDFRTNQSWPAHGKGEADGAAAGRKMLLRLQRAYPFFSCSALSSYRPRWVWSPKLTHWLVTYPEPFKEGLAEGPRLAIRVFDAQNHLSTFIKTEIASNDFNDAAVLGWMGNDVVVLALGPDQTFAWKLAIDGGLAATSLKIDDAVRARAADLKASPGAGQQFVIPSSLLPLPENESSLMDEGTKSPERPVSPAPSKKGPG